MRHVYAPQEVPVIDTRDQARFWEEFERMQEGSSREVRRILEVIGRKLDALDHPRCYLYDECPDPMRLDRLTDQVYWEVQDMGFGRSEERQKRPGCEEGRSCDRKGWDYQLIRTLLRQEVFHRRCRRCKYPKFY